MTGFETNILGKLINDIVNVKMIFVGSWRMLSWICELTFTSIFYWSGFACTTYNRSMSILG